jgi:hypothetical protein
MCSACPAGKHSLMTSARSMCHDCPAGKFTTQGSPQGYCDQCGYGKFSKIGQPGCKACPAGRHAADGNSQCAQCAGGQYAPVQSARCFLCDVGQYAGAKGVVNCTSCPVGKYQDNIGAFGCNNCEPGTYQGSTNSYHCIACPAGYYRAGPFVVAAFKGSKTDAPTAKPTGVPTWTPTNLPTAAPSPGMVLKKLRRSPLLTESIHRHVADILHKNKRHNEASAMPAADATTAADRAADAAAPAPTDANWMHPGGRRRLTSLNRTKRQQHVEGLRRLLEGTEAHVVPKPKPAADANAHTKVYKNPMGVEMEVPKWYNGWKRAPACRGSHCPSPASCLPCPNGYYTGDSWSAAMTKKRDTCNACPKGVYGGPSKAGSVQDKTSYKCTGPCALGRYGATTALTASNCTGPCRVGRFGVPGVGQGTSNCSGVCEAGRYAPRGRGACTSCKRGLFQSKTEQGTCLKCAPGHFAPFSYAGAKLCTRCPKGSFAGYGAYQCTDGHGDVETPAPTHYKPPSIAPTAKPTVSPTAAPNKWDHFCGQVEIKVVNIGSSSGPDGKRHKKVGH